MIIDALENAEKYYPLNPRFAEAFLYLRTPAARILASNREEIDGENLFVIASRGMGKQKPEVKLEVHRIYIDIHYIIQGVDVMGWKAACNCREVLSPHNSEKDAALFNDEPLIWCAVPSGAFAMFFPEDAHAPMVSDGEVHKLIVKVAV